MRCEWWNGQGQAFDHDADVCLKRIRFDGHVFLCMDHANRLDPSEYDIIPEEDWPRPVIINIRRKPA